MANTFKCKVNKLNILFFIAALLGVALDQFIKYIVVSNMTLFETIPILNNILHITYVLNDGAAFSVMSGQSWLLSGVTSVLVIALSYYLLFGRLNHILGSISLSMIISGGLGNLIDRFFRGEELFKGKVVDYIDFKIINFPVFNFADCLVVIGTILLALYVIFLDKENLKSVSEEAKDE